MCTHKSGQSIGTKRKSRCLHMVTVFWRLNGLNGLNGAPSTVDANTSKLERHKKMSDDKSKVDKQQCLSRLYSFMNPSLTALSIVSLQVFIARVLSRNQVYNSNMCRLVE